MKIDFHVHSRYSDGEYTLPALAIMAKSAGLDGFALTDHDTILGWNEISEVEKTYDIKIIPGVEISTEWKNKDVHILAYGLKMESENSLALLSRLSQSRIDRALLMVKQFNRLGIPLSIDDVLEIAGEGVPGRPHIAKAVVKKGYALSTKDVFTKYIARGGPCYVSRDKITPYECVEIVAKEGGFPVLAHPGIDRTYSLTDSLKDAGLWGLEVYHSSHDFLEEQRFHKIASRLKLQVLGGSDFHEKDDMGHGNIGTKYIDVENIDDFFK